MTDIAAPRPEPIEALEPPPLAARRAEAREVSTDLEAIFGTASPSAGAAAARAPRRQVGGPAPPPPATWLAKLGGLAAAACLGLAGGAYITRTSTRLVPPAQPTRAIPVEIAQVAQPEPGPIDPLVTLDPQPQVTAAPVVRKAHAARPRHSSPLMRRHEVRCCASSDMSSADRRLRRAYSAAVRAGVPRPILVSYRDRWASVRRERAHQPRRLIEGYGRLASGLDRAAARARGHRPQASRRYASGWPWRNIADWLS